MMPANLMMPRDLVQVTTADGYSNTFHAGTLYKIPAFKTLIDQLKDQSETIKGTCTDAAPVVPNIGVPFSLQILMQGLTHGAYNIPMNKAHLYSYKQLGFVVDEQELRNSLSVFNNPMPLRCTSLVSLVIASVAVGGLDVAVAELGRAKPPSMAVTRVRAHIQPKTGCTLHFTPPRNGDVVDTFSLRFVLPALPVGLVWRENVVADLVESFQMVMDGHVVAQQTGLVNATMARIAKLWCTSNNAYAGMSEQYRHMRSASPWRITIPLMVPETCRPKQTQLLLKDLYYSKVLIVVSLTTLQNLVQGHMPSDFGGEIDLDVDLTMHESLNPIPQQNAPRPSRRLASESTEGRYAVLDAEAEHLSENGWTTFDAEQPDAAAVVSANVGTPFPIPAVVEEKQHKSIYYGSSSEGPVQLPKSGDAFVFDIYAKHMVTGFLLTFQSDNAFLDENDGVHPFLSADLRMNGQTVFDFDAVDAGEWNWLITNNPKPAGSKSYLIPFSRGMSLLPGDHGNDAATINLSRIDCVRLHLTLNQAYTSHAKWTMTVTSMYMNVRVTEGGVVGMLFA